MTTKFNLTLPAGTHLFSAPYDEETLAAAKQWIAEHKFTEEDVRLMRFSDDHPYAGMLAVIAKKDVRL